MLKKIAVSQLQVGMYLEEFCCSWMEHPFCRAGLIIADEQDIERIAGSNVAEVWIDCGKGIDVSPDKPSISLAEAEDGVESQFCTILAQGSAGE